MRYILYSIFFLLVSAGFCQAQLTKCDSLYIQNIEYAPFNDSLIAVYVYNESSDIFSYPGFILYDANGDTVAKEIVNYFGIGNEQVHYMTIQPGVVVQENFNGTIELWSGFYSTLECTYNQQVNLCPDTTCVELFLSLSNFGGALAFSEFTWDIKNTAGIVLYSGAMELDTMQQQDFDSLCLPFGNYIVEFNSATQPMGQVFASTYTNLLYNQGPSAQFIVNNTLLDLQFYESCDPLNSIGTPVSINPITAQVINDVLYVSDLSNTALGKVSLFDSLGKLLLKQETSESRIQFDLSNYPANGVYIIQVQGERFSYSKKFIK
ncbi:MAG: T9SS type A sorting domain-containing protein [Bacteroidia bacterium]|nr:T9SS type A sorting domain-containing protein [Bacteroidia bacterium]NNM16708.1 T9SS type A sorting domain-containing protein [Bacteroidia bacterium]